MAQCGIVAVAQALLEELATEPIPADFEPGDCYYDQVVAHVRHTYTNYEELLYRLPACVDFWEQHGPAYCDSVQDMPGEECPLRQEAHDLLKVEAKRVARALYDGWLVAHPLH